MLPVTPERKAQLDDYAHRHGKDVATALDEALGSYLEWEREDSETVIAMLKAYDDIRAGRTQSAKDFLEDLRGKHAFRVEVTGEPALTTYPHGTRGC
jgi:hypothetical protein